MVPPEEPVEKVQEDKNRPPDAPTLRANSQAITVRESFSDGIVLAASLRPPKRGSHAPPSPESLRSPGRLLPSGHEGCIPSTDFQTALPMTAAGQSAAIHVHLSVVTFSRMSSRPEVHSLQGLCDPRARTGACFRPRRERSLRSRCPHSTNFGKFSVGKVLLRSAEKILHARHGLLISRAFSWVV